jgi:glutathione S-transferase
MDAGILRRYEQRFRAPEFRLSRWVEHQAATVARALAAVENEPPGDAARDIGAIARRARSAITICASLAPGAPTPALAFRLDGLAAAVPVFEATRFEG